MNYFKIVHLRIAITVANDDVVSIESSPTRHGEISREI